MWGNTDGLLDFHQTGVWDTGVIRKGVRAKLFQSTGKVLCCRLQMHYNLVPAKGRAGKVTAGLAESNSNLPPGSWLSPVGWLPRDRGQLRTLRSLIRVLDYLYLLPTYMLDVGCRCRSLPVHSAVCSQSPVRRQDAQGRGHGTAVSPENEERLDTLGPATDWNLWCRYGC